MFKQIKEILFPKQPKDQKDKNDNNDVKPREKLSKIDRAILIEQSRYQNIESMVISFGYKKAETLVEHDYYKSVFNWLIYLYIFASLFGATILANAPIFALIRKNINFFSLSEIFLFIVIVWVVFPYTVAFYLIKNFLAVRKIGNFYFELDKEQLLTEKTETETGE